MKIKVTVYSAVTLLLSGCRVSPLQRAGTRGGRRDVARGRAAVGNCSTIAGMLSKSLHLSSKPEGILTSPNPHYTTITYRQVPGMRKNLAL